MAYNLVRPEEEENPVFKGKWIWKIDTLPRICHFLWQCHHNSVPVREVIVSRGLDCEVLYPFGKNEDESIIHMLRDCPFTATFWRKLGVPVSLISSGLDILSWLEANCMYNSLIKANGYPWRSLFTFAIWKSKGCKVNSGSQRNLDQRIYLQHRLHQSIMVEFWALQDGLLLALQLGLARLEVELDAKVVVDLVLSSSVTNRDYFSILNHCRC
uniref:Reverse transcriptase zinc-binding domain-containing protein n=1 Tax=Quercus lobata TaxID=97700 RepID=A0A7N2KPI6_QUELO